MILALNHNKRVIFYILIHNIPRLSVVITAAATYIKAFSLTYGGVHQTVMSTYHGAVGGFDGTALSWEVAG